MTGSHENSTDSGTTGFKPLALTLSNGTGTQLSEIGSGKPLTISAALAELNPEETDNRLLTCLGHISGRQPVLVTQTYFPNDRPVYQLVTGVRWDCPQTKFDEVARAIAGAFRSAPEDKIAAALFRLRTLTRSREQRSDEMMEAEAVIWIEQLRCWPGDIVLDTLKTWPSRDNGQWWPTWHEVEAAIKYRADKRTAILNFVRTIGVKGTDKPQIERHESTDEQRARAVAKWEAERAVARADRKLTDAEMEERIKAELARPMTIGAELQNKIAAMAAEGADQ